MGTFTQVVQYCTYSSITCFSPSLLYLWKLCFLSPVHSFFTTVEQGLASNGPWTKFGLLPTFINKVLLEPSHVLCLRIFCSCFAGVGKTNTEGLAKPKIFAVWPFTEKVSPALPVEFWCSNPAHCSYSSMGDICAIFNFLIFYKQCSVALFLFLKILRRVYSWMRTCTLNLTEYH